MRHKVEKQTEIAVLSGFDRFRPETTGLTDRPEQPETTKSDEKSSFDRKVRRLSEGVSSLF